MKLKIALKWILLIYLSIDISFFLNVDAKIAIKVGIYKRKNVKKSINVFYKNSR